MTDLRKAAEMAIDAMMSGDVHKRAVAIIELRQALAQPEQEPAAWINSYGFWKYKPEGLDDLTPLYTAPPKREWVALTEVDLYELMDFDSYEDTFDFAKAIEAKLKEKNS